jgi:hypothetical protein
MVVLLNPKTLVDLKGLAKCTGRLSETAIMLLEQDGIVIVSQPIPMSVPAQASMPAEMADHENVPSGAEDHSASKEDASCWVV